MTKDEIIAIYIEVSNKLCNGTEWCWAGVDEPLQLFAKLIAEKAIKEALAQEQEPLTENGMYRLGYHNGYGFGEAYGKANSPRRTWVDLTRAQFAEILCDDRWQGRPELMLLQAQSKLKEKNT